MARNRKKIDDLLVFLYEKKAFGKGTSVPVTECPARGIDVKRIEKFGSPEFVIECGKIYLKNVGRVLAAAVIARRLECQNRNNQ